MIEELLQRDEEKIPSPLIIQLPELYVWWYTYTYTQTLTWKIQLCLLFKERETQATMHLHLLKKYMGGAVATMKGEGSVMGISTLLVVC